MAQLVCTKFSRGNIIGKALRNQAKLLRHCPQCQTTNLQTPNYVHPHLEIPQILMDFIDLVSLFETTTKGNQYTLIVIYMLNNYVIYEPIPDKSKDIIVNAYLKEVYSIFKGSRKILSDNGIEFKKFTFVRSSYTVRDKTFIFILLQTPIKWIHRSFAHISLKIL